MNNTFTYETRIVMDERVDHLLNSWAALSGEIERALFVDIIQGKSLKVLKSAYLETYNITARQFNSIRILVEGKIQSVKKARSANIEDLKAKICLLQKKIPKITNKLVAHEKKRKLHAMQEKLARLQAEDKAGKVSICFGGRKLFRSQYHLKENGYASFEEWKEDWKRARSSEFFCVGSKDETKGNQTCHLLFDELGNATLRLRLPDRLITGKAKYLIVENIRFSYGQDKIQEALRRGVAMSYRFKKDRKGWRVFVSFIQNPGMTVTASCLGAIGIDINSNQISAVETDAHGNPVAKYTFACNTYGKSTDQAKAIIGDVCKTIVALAQKTRKPLVIEKLDFTKKKAALKETPRKYARMLSSFHYSHVIQTLNARGYKEGVEVFSVNPAMTSIIGKIKYAKRYGLTNHQAAALAIARRYYQFSEAPPKSPMQVVHKNVLFTCPVPVRKRGQHVWTFWRGANRGLAALVALFWAPKRSPCPS